MSISLKTILSLVGELKDNSDSKERFRRYLKENVKEVGQIRDYIQECLNNKGEEYNYALQDLTNYLAEFLEFEVIFGRYKGVTGQIGFDGHWISPKGFHIVAEVKTTEAFRIKTSTLLGYINDLISEKEIPSRDNALGLYIIGRPDADSHELENSIIAENRTHQLRIISIEYLLSLAEIMNEYDVNHEDILAVLKPSKPTIDSIAELMARLAAQTIIPEPETEKEIPEEEVKEIAYWLTPVKSDPEETAEEGIKTLVVEEKIYAFGERTPGRKHIKPGDKICFYATGIGILAQAEVSSKPENKPHPKVNHPERYPWVFEVQKAKLYFNNPVIVDAELRSKLNAFKDKDPNKGWGWFVQSTRKVTEHDFKLLTRQ